MTTKANRKRFKTVTRETAASAAILDGLAAIESLKDEMAETRDNMEEKFSQTTKFQTIEETVGTLENVEFNPDIPEVLTSNDPKVTYSEDQPYGKKSLSRAAQLSNAISMISAGVSGVDELITALTEQKDDLTGKIHDIEAEAEMEAAEARENGESDGGDIMDDAEDDVGALQKQADEIEEQIDTLETFNDEMESVISEVENVEFPGMYG